MMLTKEELYDEPEEIGSDEAAQLTEIQIEVSDEIEIKEKQ